MGVYSTNRGHLGMYSGEAVVANENYNGLVGAFQMMVENAQNDQAIFDAIISEDFKEAAVAHGVLQESALTFVTEASVGGFVDKIKEFLKKAWEKIKGLFKSFLVRLNSVFVRDNKEFVNKYKKEVLSKDLSKMKYKWSAPKSLDSVVDAATSVDLDEHVTAIIRESASDTQKYMDKIDDGSYLEELIKKAVGSSVELGEVRKELHEKAYEEEDTVEGLKSSELLEIIDTLLTAKDEVKRVEKISTGIDKIYSQTLKSVDKAKTELAKNIPSEASKTAGSVSFDTNKYSEKDGAEKSGTRNLSYEKGKSESAKGSQAGLMLKLNVIYKALSEGQKLMNVLSSAALEELKFGIKQARRVFAQAAAFNPKSVKESLFFIEAVGDAEDYEVDSDFDYYEDEDFEDEE